MIDSPNSDFQHLTKYIDEWGLSTRDERLEKRLASTIDQLQAFYDAVAPSLQDIIEFLNQWPLSEIPADYQPLANTALMLCEVDNAVNKWKSSTLNDGVDPRRLKVKSNVYDSPQLDI